MNNLTPEDDDLLDGCVLRPASGISGLEAAMDPRVMPGVKRVFNSKNLIKRYTNAVMEGIDPDKKITFENREEYEPSQKVIYAAYDRHQVHAKVEKFIQRLKDTIGEQFYWGVPCEYWKTKT